MELRRLSIKNYKSVKSVEFTPGPLTALVGPNAAGKSNFADGIGFLSDLYRDGLEIAVARRGGYENIAHRKKKRSRSAIEFSVSVVLDRRESGFSTLFAIPGKPQVLISHAFSFKTKSAGIRADFLVVQETITVAGSLAGEEFRPLMSLDRSAEGLRIARNDGEADLFNQVLPSAFMLEAIERAADKLPTSETLMRMLAHLFPILAKFASAMGTMRVFQLSPDMCRGAGSPTPRPELDRFGGNLPSIVDHLQRHHPRAWDDIFSTMRMVLPDLTEIELDYTSGKMLGLYFHEEGQGARWGMSQVSAGTVQALAMLCAVYDPRTKFVVIEEPENSIHPWILRAFVDACRSVAGVKQVMLTTHSPILLNLLEPREVWIASRRGGETRIELLV
ncbi:MAG TPA: AAA family ATPase, partial [Longimicrobium sp.]|nr:AAA family ATPase [Longimicrobium sp.]